jgi:dTDP-4-amino-4,6-dideoxygalactose transaminase
MIPLFKVFMGENVLAAVSRTLYSGYIGQGPKVEEFEKKLSKYIGNDLCLTVNSATSGLHLTMHLIGVLGGEVITTPLTCTATNWPILASGATPVWCDVDPMTCNIDANKIEPLINKNTKAVVAVDWGGTPCDLNLIRSICDEHKLSFIEDAAHAFGAEYMGKKVGSIADYTVFSFQAIKHLTCVDGGALFLKDREKYSRGKLTRWYGIDREGSRKDFRCEADINEWGFKYHMNDVVATIGLSNFEHIHEILQKHRENASYYNRELRGITGIKLLPYSPESSYWIYTLRVERRNDFQRKMAEEEIMVSRVHERNDRHSCMKGYERDLPGLEELVKDMICIPVGWWVSEIDRKYIVDTIKKGW